MRPLGLLFFTLSLSFLPAEVPQAVMSKNAREFLSYHCYDCHDEATKKGRVNLESLDYNLGSTIHDAERWQEILDTVSSGEMPPKDKSQPTDKEKAKFLTELSYKMVQARKIHAEDGGKVVMRRLNQREYANTMEALTGVRLDVDHLPNDQIENGFDTMGASLFMSSGQFEQYYKMATDSLRLATQKRAMVKPQIIRYEPEEGPYNRQKWEKVLREKKQEIAKLPKGGAAAKFKQKIADVLDDLVTRPETAEGIAITFIQEVNGPHKIITPSIATKPQEKVKLRIRAGAYEVEDPRFNYLEINLLGRGGGRLGEVKIEAPVGKPEIIEVELDIPDGAEDFRIALYQRGYQPGSATDRHIYRKKGQPYTPIGVWVDWVEVETSGLNSGYTHQMEYFLPERPDGIDEETYVKAVLERYTKLAFRGKDASPEYLSRLRLRYKKNREDGDSLQEALIDPMALALTSPSFLYMVEGGDKKTVPAEDLAVRLSYFLWGSPPDKELMAAAKNGSLKRASVLTRQVERLLEDPRSMYFIKGFCFQWLGMDRLGMFPFDTHKHNGFDNAVIDASMKEMYESFKYAIDHNYPSKALLHAPYIVINNVMADHYAIQGVQGSHFRKVDLKGNSIRGGFLGMAAFHAIGSDGVNSSPVERGVWVLKHLLGTAPPPAPPNIPQLDRVKDGFMSVREMVKMHREAPQCSQCHQYIDPVGMGLEQFDAAGRWRTKEVAEYNGKEKELRIDSSGRLPLGDSFMDYYGLRKAVAKQDAQFANVLIEELLSYSLGRQFQFTDKDLAEEILKKTQPTGYRLKDLITQIVLSDKFVSK